MRKVGLSLAILVSAVAFTACDSVDVDAEVGTYVVEAILVAGEPLPSIRLSQAAPLGGTYNIDQLGVANASMSLRLESDQSETRYAYTQASDAVGVYHPLDQTAVAQPLGTYHLEILTETVTITSKTTVPDTFRVLRGSLDEGTYQGVDRLEITHTPSRSPGRARSYFIIITEALEPDQNNLTPLAMDILEQEIGDATLESLRVSGSPILNEDSIELNSDGSLTFTYPWLGINFFGRNRIGINALDDNAYDFLRSQSVQQGGSTFAPGEIPNPLESLDGAHGLFGSVARAWYDFVVLRPPATVRASSP